MLDTADIRHFVIPKIRETILYINRYEKAAEAIATIIGMGASLQVRPKLSDLPQDAAELVLRKRELAELYGFVEQNYAHLLISGILFRSDSESKQKSIKAYH